MAKVVVLFGRLATAEDCDAAEGLLKRRRGEIAADEVKHAIDHGYLPGTRVEILRADMKRNERYGVIDGANAVSFTVRLDSGRFDRFAPNEIRLAPSGT